MLAQAGFWAGPPVCRAERGACRSPHRAARSSLALAEPRLYVVAICGWPRHRLLASSRKPILHHTRLDCASPAVSSVFAKIAANSASALGKPALPRYSVPMRRCWVLLPFISSFPGRHDLTRFLRLTVSGFPVLGRVPRRLQILGDSFDSVSRFHIFSWYLVVRNGHSSEA